MSDVAFSALTQQIKECSYDEKITLLSFIADLLKHNPKIENKPKRKFGELKGKIFISEGFDETPECFKDYI